MRLRPSITNSLRRDKARSRKFGTLEARQTQNHYAKSSNPSNPTSTQTHLDYVSEPPAIAVTSIFFPSAPTQPVTCNLPHLGLELAPPSCSAHAMLICTPPSLDQSAAPIATMIRHHLVPVSGPRLGESGEPGRLLDGETWGQPWELTLCEMVIDGPGLEMSMA